MGFLDDMSGILSAFKDLNDELESLRDEVVSSVLEPENESQQADSSNL